MHLPAVREPLLKMQKSWFQQRPFQQRLKNENENSHHVFDHVTTLRAQGDVRDVAL